MFRIETDFGRNPAVVRRTGKQIFYAPLKWTEPNLIFTCSMSDWFHPAADGWRDEAWGIIKQTPQHTYRILTKRPELIRERDENGKVIKDRLPEGWDDECNTTWRNVHLGVTVESQQYAEGYRYPTKGWVEGRMAILRRIPAVKRWVSCEPLLSPVKLDLGGFHWLVAGAESDREAPRKAEEQWFLDLRDQAARAHMPFLFLAMGGSKPCSCGCHSRWGCRRLNGRLWQQFPFPAIVAEPPLSKTNKERTLKKAEILRVLDTHGVRKFGSATQYCISPEIYKETNNEIYKILLMETIDDQTFSTLQTALPDTTLTLETWP